MYLSINMKKKIKTVETKTAKLPKKNGRPSAVDYDKFVKLWSTAGSVGEVAKALGIKANSASAIAARLRENNVELRRFPRRMAQTIDIKHLNKLAKSK